MKVRKYVNMSGLLEYLQEKFDIADNLMEAANKKGLRYNTQFYSGQKAALSQIMLKLKEG